MLINKLDNANDIDVNFLGAMASTNVPELDALLEEFKDRFPDNLPKISDDDPNVEPLYISATPYLS